MQAETIILDGTPKGPIHSLLYPVRYVQVFRPCSWTEFDSYICESDRFRNIMSERCCWLEEQRIRHIIRYEVIVENPDNPHHYRLFTEFKCKEGADSYIGRWCNGAACGPQSQDAATLVCSISGSSASA